MSIRPIDFNGMIQNTHEVASTKANEDNKANLQQQNVQVNVMHEEQTASSTVQQMEETQQHEYNYKDGDGDGRGYDAKGRKKSKKKKQLDNDGVVRIKTGQPSFDIKI